VDGSVEVSACRSCGAEIIWALTENGKRIPLDAEPYAGDSPSGLFVLRQFSDEKTAIATTPDAFPGEYLWRSHFASCPQAKEWRK